MADENGTRYNGTNTLDLLSERGSSQINKLAVVLRSSLALSFLYEKPIDIICLLWLQSLLQRFIHINEERSSSATLWTGEIASNCRRLS